MKSNLSQLSDLRYFVASSSRSSKVMEMKNTKNIRFRSRLQRALLPARKRSMGKLRMTRRRTREITQQRRRMGRRCQRMKISL